MIYFGTRLKISEPTNFVDVDLGLTDETVTSMDDVMRHSDGKPTRKYSRRVSAVNAEFMSGTSLSLHRINTDGQSQLIEIMTSSLIPEKPLLVYPSLAATLGLEESIMLGVLADCVSASQGTEQQGFCWHDVALEQLQSLLPFWNVRDLQRISTNLREKGVVIVNSPPLEQSTHFRFAFNERAQQQVNSGAANSHSKANTQAPRSAGHQDYARQAPSELHSSFLSKNFIGANWQPDQTTLQQLAQHSIPSSFALQQVPEFVTYWRERGDKHHSWGAKFIQHTLRMWRDFQAQQNVRDQEVGMSSNWTPSLDAIEILTEQAGIKREFIEDAIPEFILYWSERGERHRTWNTKFVHHVRMQWIKFNAALEHNSVPRAIASSWQPSEDVYDVLRLANIDLNFSRSVIPEFVLYWRDRGDLTTSWNTKYLQHVKRLWAQRHTLSANDTQQRSTRDISLEEQLTDRSWAN